MAPRNNNNNNNKRPLLLPLTTAAASPTNSFRTSTMEAAAAAAAGAAVRPPAPASSQSSRWNFGKKRRQQRNHGDNGYGSFAGADARRTPEALLDLPRGSPLDERSQLLGAADHDDDDDDNDAAAQAMEEGSSSSPYIVIAGFEMALRLLVLFAAMFWIGTMLPGQAMRAARILEYAVVAWGTIVALRLLVVMFANKANRPPRTSSSASSSSCCRRLWLYDRNGKGGLDVRAATTAATRLEDEENALLLDEDDAMEGILDRDEHVNGGVDRGLDPSLAALYMVDTISRVRAVFNDKETPLPLETDYFSGHMLAFIRQPGGGGPPYFYGKQRRFEFQYQVVLKRVPDGVVYFGCSLQHPLKLNLMQRTLVNAAMAFCRTSNPDLAYTLSGDHPYMAFPVVTVRTAPFCRRRRRRCCRANHTQGCRTSLTVGSFCFLFH
jgi:hypothetical protein